MPSRDNLAKFVQWCANHTGDEMGQVLRSFVHIAVLDETAGAG